MPNTCPECETTLIGKLTYSHNHRWEHGEYVYDTAVSHYCPRCDENVPKLLGKWSKWKPRPEDFFTDYVESRKG